MLKVVLVFVTIEIVIFAIIAVCEFLAVIREEREEKKDEDFSPHTSFC